MHTIWEKTTRITFLKKIVENEIAVFDGTQLVCENCEFLDNFRAVKS